MSTFRINGATIQRNPYSRLYKVNAGRCESTIRASDMKKKVEQAKETKSITFEDWLDEERDATVTVTDQEITELAAWVQEQGE